MLPGISDPTEYGLPFDDYDSDGVIDPTTEQTAAQYEKDAVDLAAMTHTAARAIVVCTVAGAAITVTSYRSVWGDAAGVYPTATYTGAGNYLLTWLVGGYPDLNPTVARRVTRAPAFVAAGAIANAIGVVAGIMVPQTAVTANTVVVQIRNSADALADASFTVWVY
jgi:hypothetical protein